MKTEFIGESITVGITGASGAPYALSLLTELRKFYAKVYVLYSDAARVVFATELLISIPENTQKAQQILNESTQGGAGELIVFSKLNWMSPVASGSSAPKQMVICPCSTGTLSSIAVGASDNLLERAADVVLKENGQLIIVPRETPFSSIHLQNMLTLSKAGATILPAAPGFYHQPKSVDDLVHFIVARILEHLKVPQDLIKPWGYSKKHSEE